MINLLNKIVKLFKRPNYWNDKEAKLIEVVTKMIASKDTDIVCNPMSNIYYVSNEKLHYYMKITDFEITITNTKFNYNHAYNSKFGNELLAIVRDAINLQVDEFDRNVFHSEVNLLTNIEKSIR